jgi:hypothetical protein
MISSSCAASSAERRGFAGAAAGAGAAASLAGGTGRGALAGPDQHAGTSNRAK